jgi:predicted PurR-regulated permease PerM
MDMVVKRPHPRFTEERSAGDLQMTAGDDQEPDRILSSATIDFAIRLGFVALLGYWTFRVIAPFLTIGLWSAILAVALYPVFDWLARWSSPRAAAALVTVLCLTIVVGPLTWLGLGMIGGVSSLVSDIDTGHMAFPLPPEAVKTWMPNTQGEAVQVSGKAAASATGARLAHPGRL